ncbi:MAG: hypothetical protein IJZ79_01760 [Bacilli bacterium]|nr:hypothetical protein [Bacilli bacterium]
MELITYIIMIIGLLLVVFSTIALVVILFGKPHYYEWTDYLRYNKSSLLVTIILFVFGIVFISPMCLCKTYGEKLLSTTTYKLIEVNDSYIASNYENNVRVYVRGNAENTIETAPVYKPIYIISNDIEPKWDHIKITYKWFIFEISEYENEIYLNDY